MYEVIQLTFLLTSTMGEMKSTKASRYVSLVVNVYLLGVVSWSHHTAALGGVNEVP